MYTKSQRLLPQWSLLPDNGVTFGKVYRRAEPSPKSWKMQSLLVSHQSWSVLEVCTITVRAMV